MDVKRYANEIKKNAQFNNDKIATLYYADTSGEHLFTFFEYCAGITLREYLKNGSGYLERLYLLNSIVSVMWDLYKNNIYHGDLHCNNIMVNDKYIIKILDFGTSIFAKDKDNSRRRDANMIYDLAIEILPEIKDFSFFNDHVRSQSSLDISECIIWIIGLLCYEINNSDDGYEVFLNYLARMSVYCSGFSTKDIIEYISGNHIFLIHLKYIEKSTKESRQQKIEKLIISSDNFLRGEIKKYYAKDSVRDALIKKTSII